MRAASPNLIPASISTASAGQSAVVPWNWEGLAAWRALTAGDREICVAVLDGPVNLAHPVFARAHLRELRLPEEGCRPAASSLDHGTHVASILFGDPATGVPGLAPECRGVLIPIFEETAEGQLLPCPQAKLAAAIDLAVASGAQIINISAGQWSSDGTAEEVLVAAVRRASRTALIVAAAGNDGCECLHVPGALPGVLAVGAMDAAGEPLAFSNWGETYRDQGLLAPGDGIVGAVAADSYVARSGTSFAAPLVAGIAALALSVARRRGMVLTPSQLRELLLKSTDEAVMPSAGRARRELAGRLNLMTLLNQIEQQGESTVKLPSQVSPESNAGTGVMASTVDASQVGPSAGCGCGCGGEQLAYVIGHLGFDFESEARRDSIQQAMRPTVAVPSNPAAESPFDLMRHLRGFEEIHVAAKCGKIEKVERDGVTGLVKITTTLDSPVIDVADSGRQIAIFGLLERFTSTTAFKPSVLNADLNAKTRIRRTGPREFLLDRCPTSVIREFDVKCATWVLPTTHSVTTRHPSHWFDSPAIAWTLRRGQVTLYVVRPSGPFSEAGFQELSDFLMNHHGWSQSALNLYYYECCGETKIWSAPWDPRFNDTAFASGNFNDDPTPAFSKYAPVLSVPVTERVALPGRVRGKVNLRNCVSATVLHPELRGAAEWSAKRLFEMIQSEVAPSSAAAADKLARKIKELLERLDEDVRNPGLTPQHRALNFASTQQSELLRLVRADLEGDFEVDTVRHPEASNHCRPGSDCWDVEISFFNPENVQESPILVRQTVDVSDVVPVLIDRPRRFRRR